MYVDVATREVGRGCGSVGGSHGCRVCALEAWRIGVVTGSHSSVSSLIGQFWGS